MKFKILIILFIIAGALFLAPSPALATNTGGQFSSNVWVRPETSVASKAIVAKAEEMRVFTDASGFVGCQIKVTTWQTAAQATTSALAINTWSYVTCTYDRANIKVYVNGILVATQAQTNVPDDTAAAWKIGQDDSAGTTYGNMAGTIDQFTFYDYARTPAQIIDDMRGDGSMIPVNSNVGGSATGTQPAVPVGYWRFDEGYGTTGAAHNDGSGGSALAGTLANMSATYSATSGWQPASSGLCKVNGCLAFDGSNDYVNIPDNTAVDPSGDFSLSIWFKTTSNGGFNPLFGKGGADNNNTPYAFYTTGGQVAALMGSTSSVTAISTNPTTFNDGNWHHAVYTVSGTTMTIYVDGKSRGTGSFSGTRVTNTNPLYIGRTPAGATYFTGSLDEPKIFNFALTPDQVKNDYNQGASVNYGTGAALESSLLSDGTGVAPVGYWNFEEGSGSNVNDISGNGNVGTWQGTLGKQWATGKIGKAGNFNGTDNYVSIADSSTLSPGAGNYTVSAWMKISGSLANEKVIFRNNGSGTGTVQLALETDGKIQCFYRDGSGNSININGVGSALNTGVWHYLSCVRNGTSAFAYVDGVQVGTLSNSSLGTITTTGAAKFIGSINTTSEFWSGQIDEIKIYNYARTQAQVAYDYNRGLPVGWWKFDECEGTTLHDSSGNSNSGTWAGGTLAGTCNTASTAWGGSAGTGANGKFNGALTFNGSSDYVSVAQTSGLPLYNNTAYTLSLWVKNADLTQAGKAIFDEGNNSTGTPFWYLETDNTDPKKLNFGWRSDDNSVFNGITSNQVITDNNWHHIVLIVDKTTPSSATDKIYVDGTLRSINNPAFVYHAITLNLTSIGAFIRNTSSSFFNGQIDDVRIYNYALSASQVKEVYDNGSSVFYGPVTGSP